MDFFTKTSKTDISKTSKHNIRRSQEMPRSTPDSSIANQKSQELLVISPTLPAPLRIKCGVCGNRRLSALNNPHLCKKCYQFCLTVQCNKLPMRCRQDSSCLKFTTTQFCPDHMYQKCLQFIDINNDSSFESIMNSSAESNSSSITSQVIEEHKSSEKSKEIKTKHVNVTNTKKISPSKRKSQGVMCGVCHKRRISQDNKLCTQCYKYYHMVDSQQIAVNCTQDIRCTAKNSNQFCPLHRFKACQQLIQNDGLNKRTNYREVRVLLEKLNIEITAKKMNIDINSSTVQMNQCDVHTSEKANESVINSSKEASKSIINNSNKVSEAIFIPSKESSEYVVNKNKKTSESIVNNNQGTTKSIINNNKETTKSIVNHNKESTEYIKNINEETTEFTVNNSKETFESIINNKETTESTVNNNKKKTEHVDNTTKNVTQSVVNTHKASAHFVLNINSLDEEIDSLEKELNLLEEKENKDQNSNDVQTESNFLKMMPGSSICQENTTIENPNDENTSNSQKNSNHSDVQNKTKILKLIPKSEMCQTNLMNINVPDHKNTLGDPQNNSNYSEDFQKTLSVNETTALENESFVKEIQKPFQDKTSFFCISVNANSEVPQNILEKVSKSKISSKILSQKTSHVLDGTTRTTEKQDDLRVKSFRGHSDRVSIQRNKKAIELHDIKASINEVSKLNCQNPGTSEHLCKSDETSSVIRMSGSHKSKSKHVKSKEAPKENKSLKNNEQKQSSNSEINSKNTLQNTHLHEKVKKRSAEFNATGSEKKTNKSKIVQSENLDHKIDKSHKRNSNKLETNTLIQKTEEHNQSEDGKIRKGIERKVNKNVENSIANSIEKKSTINIETNFSSKAKKNNFREEAKTFKGECFKEHHSKVDKQKIEKRKCDSLSSYKKGILLHKKMKLQENVEDNIKKYKNSNSQNEFRKHVKVNSKVESYDTTKKKEETTINQSQKNTENSMKEISSIEPKAQHNLCLENETKIISSELNQSTTDGKIVNDTKEFEQPKKSSVILDFVVHDELDFEEEFPDSQLSNVNAEYSKDVESEVKEPAAETEKNYSQIISINPNNINEMNESKDDGSKKIDVEYTRHEGSSSTFQMNTKEKIGVLKNISPQPNDSKVISPNAKDMQKMILPPTLDVPGTTSPQLKNVSSKCNDGEKIKKPPDFLTNNFSNLRKELTEQRRPLLKYLSQVSLERRENVLQRLLTPKSSDPIHMAIACYALYWNSNDRFRLADFFNLLHSELETRYETFLNIVMRLVIVLAHDEDFSEIIHQYAKDCGKTHLIPQEKRKNILKKMILPAVIVASGLLFHCFKIMVADNLEIPDTLMLETGRKLANLRQSDHLEYFVDTLLEIYSGRIPELLDKLRNNNNPILPYFLQTLPEDVACKYLKIVRPDGPQQNINRTLYHMESSRENQQREQFLENQQNSCETQNSADQSDNRHLGFSNTRQSESMICRSQSISSSTSESSFVSDIRNSTVLKPHFKNGIFDNSSRHTASRDNISLSTLGKISDDNFLVRSNSPLNMNEPSDQSPCGRFSPEPLFGDETLASPDAEVDIGLFDKGSLEQVANPTFDSIGKGGSLDPLALSSSISPKSSSSQVFGGSKSMTTSSHVFGQPTSNPLKRSNPHNPVEQIVEHSSKLICKSISDTPLFGETTNSQESQKSSLAPFCISNPMISRETNSETSASQVIGPLLPKFIFKPPLSSNSNPQLLEQQTLFSSSNSIPQLFGQSTALFSNSNPQLLEQQTLFSSSNCKSQVFGQSTPKSTLSSKYPQLFGQSTPLSSNSNPQSLEQTTSLSSSNSNQCISLQTEKNTLRSFSLSENKNISQPAANLTGTLSSTPGIFGLGNNFPQSANLFGTLGSTPGLFGIEKTFLNSWNPSNRVEVDNDITVLNEIPKSKKIIDTINLLSDESNDSVDADTSPVPVARTVSFIDPADSNDPNLHSPRDNHLNNSTNIDADMHRHNGNVIMEDTPTTSADCVPLFPDVDRGVEECNENTPKPKKRKTVRISYKDQIEDVREIRKDLREKLLARQLEKDSASSSALPVKNNKELCNDANEFISRLRSNYNSMNASEKLQFIHEFYSSQLPQSHFEFILHQCGYSEPLLRNLFSVVLNRLTEPEIPMAWNDAKDHALMLITRNMHDFIHTSVIRMNWTPLRTGLFLCRFLDYTEKAFSMLERYNLLDKDRSAWQLPWKEEDMEEYCVCLSLLLRSFDGTVFKCIRFCQTLLFWYKETPENFSSSGLDFPSILHITTQQLLNEYFFISVESNDKNKEYDELGAALLPLIQTVVAETRLSSALTRGCVCYFVHMKRQDLAVATMRAMPLSPPIYSVYEEGDVIHIKDIYLKEEMAAILKHALKNISPELVDQVMNNQTVIKIHLEKFSLTTAGHLAQTDLKHDLPQLFSLMGRRPGLQERVLDSLDDLQHIIDTELTLPGGDTLLLDPLLTVAVVRSFQNTRMLKETARTEQTWHE